MRAPHKILFRAAALLFLALTAAPAPAGEIVLNSRRQLQYAVELMEQGRWQKAAGELERWQDFFSAQEPEAPWAAFLLALAKLEAGQVEAAREAAAAQLEQKQAAPDPALWKLLLAEGDYRQGRYAEAREELEKLARSAASTTIKNAALYRLGWTRLKAGRWQAASEAFGALEPRGPWGPEAQGLSHNVLEGLELPQKSPTRAGTLAALLPGLGHLYVGRPKDGAVAFLLNGLFVWAALQAFESDQEVLGGMLCFLELGWYSGNIYSAVNAAHKYNRKVRGDFIKSLADSFALLPLAASQGGLGLVVKVPF